MTPLILTNTNTNTIIPLIRLVLINMTIRTNERDYGVVEVQKGNKVILGDCRLEAYGQGEGFGIVNKDERVTYCKEGDLYVDPATGRLFSAC